MFHVEHQLFRLFKRIFILAILCLFVGGCKSEHPNPELLDPIYSDMKKEAEEASKGLLAAKKELEDAILEKEKADSNSIELKNAERAYWKAQDTIKKLEVAEKYTAIRAERRKVEARRAYREAFKAGKEWPEPSEYSGYQTNKRLRSVSLNWNTRVPKLEQREPASAPKEKK